MSQEIKLVLQAAENGNRRDVPGLWTPKSTLAEIMESMQSELTGISMENATMRYLQTIVPQSKWSNTKLKSIGLTQGGRALLILKLGAPDITPASTSNSNSSMLMSSQDQTQAQPEAPKDPLEKAVEILLDRNFDADTKVCIVTLMKVLDNVLQKPKQPKVRSIRLANAAFSEKVVERKGGGMYGICIT